MHPKTNAPERAIITTWTGRHVDVLRPEVADVHIDDIAASLANKMRFGGHTARRYSVAEHCLLGVEWSLPQHKLEFLLHDAAEAYLGDICAPLKGTALFESFRALEESWWAAVAARFGVRARLPKEIHVIDMRMRLTEQRDLKGRNPESTDAYKPLPMVISASEPSGEWLRAAYLAKFYELVGSTVGAKR